MRGREPGTPREEGTDTDRSHRAGLTRADLWNERTVAWYERADRRSNYAATVFGVVADLLADCRTALDVGAGFGALALPLARRLVHVTALEPAPAMAAALRGAAAREGLRNLTVHEAAWGDAHVGPHDLVLCAHVSSLLAPGSLFLVAVGRIAERGVVLVRDLPGGEDKFFFGELYPLLLGRPYAHRCDGRETLEGLERLGVAATVTPIEYDSDQPFDSLEEACDFWMEYMRPTDAGARAFLRAFLAERLARDGQGWLARFRKRAVVIQWRTGRAGG